MSKFKVGDTPTIRSDINTDDEPTYITDIINNIKGKVATIIGTWYGEDYMIDLDGGQFIWYDDDFEENLKNNENYNSANLVIPTVSEVDKCDKISLLLDGKYLEYIKTQNVSTDEKLAVKKFIEYIRKSNIETK